MDLKRLIVTSLTALTLGYCGAAYANKGPIRARAELENGTTVFFKMSISKLRCELGLWKYNGDAVLNKHMKLVDYNCDNTVDEIHLLNILPFNPKITLKRHIGSNAYAPLFDKATKAYIGILKKYDLQEEVEAQIDRRKQAMETGLETLFK